MQLLPALAVAAEDPAPSLGGSVLQLVFGLALILGLLFATLWLLKKISVPRGAEGSMIRVVSAAAVGPRERVVLVDIGEKRLVLGVAPGQVSLLDTLAVPTETSSEPQVNTAALPGFAQWLKQALAKRNE